MNYFWHPTTDILDWQSTGNSAEDILTDRSKVDSGCLCFVNEWQFLSSKGMIKIMKEASVVKGSGDWHDTREISYSPKISKDKRGLGTVHGWNRRFTYVTTYTPIRIAFRHKSATEKLRGWISPSSVVI